MFEFVAIHLLNLGELRTQHIVIVLFQERLHGINRCLDFGKVVVPDHENRVLEVV